MDKNKLKYLNLLKENIEELEKYRKYLQTWLNIINSNNVRCNAKIESITKIDKEEPYIDFRVLTHLVHNEILDLTKETKVFIILALDNVDTKLLELREEFENN
jgi:hypothetical protein